MTIQFRAVNAPAAVGGSTLVINKPTGTLTDDFLILQTMGPVEVPDTWTLIPQSEIDDPAKDIALWYRVATASEPANYTIVGTSSAVSACIIGFFSDVSSPIHVDTIAQQINASNTNRDWPSVTVTASASMLCCFASMGNATSTPAAGFTERWDLDNPKRYLMTKALASSGATGTVTATGTAIASNCVTLAISEGVQAAFSGPQYRGHRGVAIASAPASISIVVPAALVVGDLMVMTLIMDTLKTVTTPTGWTLLTSMVAATPDLYVFTKIAVAGDIGATITISYTSGAVGAGVSMVAYFSPAGKFLSVDTFATSVNASNASELFPSVTTTKAISQLLYVGGMSGNFGISTQPVGTHHRYFSGSGPRFNELTHALFASGATGTYTLTRTGANNSNTITIAVVELDAIIGIEATTLDALTLSATGKLAIIGGEAGTLDNLTLASTAKLAIVGSLAVTLQDATLASSAPLSIIGTLAVTLANLTLAATAVRLIYGSQSVTLGDVTLSATGKLAILGSEGVTLDALTLAAEGVLTPLAPSLLVTELPVLVEITGDGVDVSEIPILVEIAATGVYVTEIPVIVEVGAIGVYITQEVVFIELESFVPEETMAVVTVTNAGTRAMHSTLPDEVVGYAFDPQYSWWSTVVPEESTNLIINSSFEKWDSFNHAAEYSDSGSVNIVYSEFPPVGSTHGRRCVKMTTGVGEGYLYYETPFHVTPGSYTFSLDFYSTRTPFTLTLLVVDSGSLVTLGKAVFTIRRTGWYRYHATFVTLGTTDVVLRCVLPANNSAGVVTYTDAWQFENKAYPTTYLDGDMVSTNDVRPFHSYFWHGEAHASPSTRREFANTGGRPISWNNLVGFLTTNLIGLDMSPIELRLQQMSDGSEVHEGVNHLPRDFSITGRIYGEDYTRLKRKHNSLVDLLKPNKAVGQPQTILRYQRTDSTGAFIGPPMDIVCAYQEGLAGSINGLYQETLPLKFHASDPRWRDTIENSFDLQLFETLTANGIIYRNETGAFSNLGTGDTDAIIRKVGFMRDGSPVAIGSFSQLAGDSVEDVAHWDGENWVVVDSLPGGTTIACMDTGYTTGYRMVIGTTDSVYEYDDVTDDWNLLGSFDGHVKTIKRDNDGNIFIGGLFVHDDPSTLTLNGVARWDYVDETWGAMQEGLLRLDGPDDVPAIVNDLLPTNDGSVWVVGEFYKAEESALATTVLSTNAIRWDDTTGQWISLASGFDEPPLALVFGKDGFVYTTGPFTLTTAGIYSVDMRGFARYTGYQWEEVFPLLSVDGSYGATGMAVDESGVFWFFKQVIADDDRFDVSPYLGPVEFFGWKDGVFYPPFLSDTLGMWDMSIGPGDRMIISIVRFADEVGPPIVTGTLTAPASNEINYGGSTNASLVVHMEGALNPVFIDNLTLKGGIYFRSNFSLGDEERFTLRTDAQRTMVYSNSRSNLQKFIVAGLSQINSISLLPGRNRISVFCLNPGDDALGWLTWQNCFWGNDGMV